MKIEQANLSDLEEILSIYSESREFMKEHGNFSQWKDYYPPEEMIINDIESNNLYVVIENERIIGVFALIEGEDKTYKTITGGKWLNNLPYVTLHRLGSRRASKGISKFVFDYIKSRYSNIRADTHVNNLPMNNSLLKNGFVRCGHIFLEDKSQRTAYQYYSKK